MGVPSKPSKHTRATSFEDQLVSLSSDFDDTPPPRRQSRMTALLGVKGSEKGPAAGAKVRQSSIMRLTGRSGPLEPANYDKFEAVMDRFWDFLMATNPEEATVLGVHTHDDRFGHCTEQQNDAVITTCQSALRTLNRLFPCRNKKSFAGWSRKQKVTYNCFRHLVEQKLKSSEDRLFLMPLDSFNGIHTWMPWVLSRMKFRDNSDYETYLRRLEEIPRVVQEQIDAMRIGLKEGITPPRISLEGVADQLDSFIMESPTVFHKPIDNFDQICQGSAATALQSSLLDIIDKKVLPAFANLAKFVREEYYPNVSDENCIEKRLPNGNSVYQNLIFKHTSSRMTATEIHKVGLEEVRRIRTEMERVARQEGFKGVDGIDRYADYMRNSKEFIPKSVDELLTAYRAVSMKIMPQLPKFFGKLPRTPLGVRAIPDSVAHSTPAVYYDAPEKCRKNPGWLNANCSKLEERKLYNIETFVLHEGLPGHHLQMSLAFENGNLPLIRKYLSCTAYVEGWGLYAESLGSEFGLHDKPSSYFARLELEMLRACRLVVDTGMHHKGWSKEQAEMYMGINKCGTSEEVQAEITRYLTMPGQALAYKLGELKIQHLKKQCTDLLGKRFNLREFHDVVLGVGSVPLTVLDKVVMDWAHDKKNQKPIRRKK